MTRHKDIFWAVLAAGTPWFFTLGTGRIELMLENYMKATFNFIPTYMGFLAIYVLLGLALAGIAIRYGSSPRETSRLPMTGIVIGWISSIVMVISYFMPVLIQNKYHTFGGQLWLYGGRENFLYAGFYTAVALYYWKRHTFVTREELKNEAKE